MTPPLRCSAIKAGAVFIVVLLLGIQPNWTPLLRDLQIARESPSLTANSLEAIADAYSRQPWKADRARAAGLAQLAAGNYEAALEALNAAAHLGGWTPDLHIAAGDAYNGKQDTAKAVAQWELALPQRLEDTALLRRLAVAYEKRQQYPQAAAVLRTLVALEPENAVAHYRFGVVLSVIDPPSAPSHLVLAAGLDKSVQPFADSLNRALAAGLDSKDSAYTAGVVGYTLIGLKEYALAREALQNAVNARPDFAEAYAYLGLAEDRLGGDGLYAYQKALSFNDNLGLAHYLLGLHYRRLRDNDRAIPELDRAFKLDPLNAAAAAELGSAYVEQADLATAEIWYTRAVQVAANEADFWILLAQFYLDHDLKVDSAGLMAAQKAVELAPDSAAANEALGFAYYLNSQFGLSEVSLHKAIEIDPRYARAYLHLGLLYLDTKRAAEARQALESAIAVDPESPTAGLALKAMARLGTP